MLEDPEILEVNLMEEIKSMEEFEDRNYIKMVCDLRGDALYFSIEAISKLSKSRNDSKLYGYVLSRFYEIFLLIISKWSQPHLEIA